MTEYIQINPADNVAVALHSLSKGTVIEVTGRYILH
jgi:altronate hydrolase